MAAKIYEHALLIKMPTELVQRIDEARRKEPDIPNRSEMIRRLVELGLGVKGE